MMNTSFPHRLNPAYFVLAACLSMPDLVRADTASDEWWNGEWNCEIGGRPAQMKWTLIEDAVATEGSQAMTSPASRWQGSLSKDGTQWVPLTQPTLGKEGSLYFRLDDGHKWYLQKAVDNKVTGWTRVRAQRNAARHPIVCWR